MKNPANPWTTLSSKEIYDNRWIQVTEHQVINPNGGEGIYGTVHFKNRAIGIIPIDGRGYTWLVGQYRYALEEYSWEIPMGGGLLDIEPLDAAKKELKEETGLRASDWTELLKIHTSNSVTDEVGFVFLARNLVQGETEFEETEDLKIWHLPFNDALEMAMDGRITDSLSLAGIFKAAKVLQLWN
jgi:8-oxo-dGTP pyrophosphatase MutT (NUDIX family)